VDGENTEMYNSVLVLIRGDVYRSFRGASVGDHVEEQIDAFRSIKTHLIDPLLTQRHRVNIIVDCNCIDSKHEETKRLLMDLFQEHMTNCYFDIPEHRLPTQHDSIKHLLLKHEAIIRLHDFVVLARADLCFDRGPFDSVSLPHDKVLVLCPHMDNRHNEANDTFWVCPRALYDRFIDFHSSPKYCGMLLRLPCFLPVKYCDKTPYGTSHKWYNPFYHYVGRDRFLQ
jgi:hypothetical protein